MAVKYGSGQVGISLSCVCADVGCDVGSFDIGLFVIVFDVGRAVGCIDGDGVSF